MRRLRGQFWPDGPIMTRLETRDVTLHGEMYVGLILDVKGKLGGFVAEFLAKDATPKYGGPTATRDFERGNQSIGGLAKEVLDYCGAGLDVIDPYFDTLRDGDMTEDQYEQYVKDELGVPVTTGVYKLRWNPRRTNIPDAVVQLAAGEAIGQAGLDGGEAVAVKRAFVENDYREVHIKR